MSRSSPTFSGSPSGFPAVRTRREPRACSRPRRLSYSAAGYPSRSAIAQRPLTPAPGIAATRDELCGTGVPRARPGARSDARHARRDLRCPARRLSRASPRRRSPARRPVGRVPALGRYSVQRRGRFERFLVSAANPSIDAQRLFRSCPARPQRPSRRRARLIRRGARVDLPTAHATSLPRAPDRWRRASS